MAIVQEHFIENGIEFIRTYSDEGRYIHGGFPEADYSEAIDPAEYGRTYIEGDLIRDDTSAEDIVSVLLGED